MALATGTRIGPFEIIGVLGAGGMGEVYRARDARLGRDAALKLLPETLAMEPDRVARFRREAQVLASLSHPNIGGIYGFEEAETATGPLRALVLELVEGETLADRIARGPIPTDEALPVVRQIAEALQAAHDQNVIHRDLKPANIKITPDGVVKVLDFGLAKLSGPPDLGARAQAESSSATALVTVASAERQDSPTLESPARTGVGTILGTAYMAPEQAKGRPADKRSDVWALGCVMYEMLTGARPFQGDDVADTLAAVLRAEPDWTRLPPDVPPPVSNVLRKCLEKERRTRAGDVAAVLFALDQARTAAPAAVAPPASRRRRVVTTAAFSAVAAGLTAAAVWTLMRPAPAMVTRLSIAPDEEHAFAMSPGTRDIAISRDGRRVVYFGGEGKLIVRSLDSLESTVIDGLEGPFSPFFSPDGQSIGYMRRNADVRVIPVGGGPGVRRAGMDSAQGGGATWSRDGRIVYATTDRVTGLLDVPPGASDGTVLTRPDRARGEADHLWPEFLPDGRAVLFTITQLSGQASEIALYDFATMTTKVLLSPGTHAHYVPTGHLVYSAAGGLRAIRFDLDSRQTIGESMLVVPGVVTKAGGAANFDVSENGTLVYAPGSLTAAAERELVWVARDGTTEPLGAPLRAYQYPRIAPDGTRVVLDVRDQDNDLWLWDLRSRTLTRFTNTPALERFPVWTPDSRSVLFVSDRSGSAAIYRQLADGGGEAEAITDATEDQQTPISFSRDGKLLLLDFRFDIASLPLDGSRRQITRLLETPASEMRPALSPDGRWVAYHSDESGRMEVYVRPFPAMSSRKWQVSPNGGVEPWWSHTGDELFFVSTATRQLTSVRVGSDSTWSPAPPTVVFKEPYFWGTTTGAATATFDVAADGRLLMIRNASDPEASPAPTHLVVVQNWTAELRRLLP